MKPALDLLSQTYNEWFEDKAERLGAALAFYAAFSIAPMLVIVVAVVDLFYSGDTLAYVRSQIGAVIGYNAAEAAVAMIQSVKSGEGGMTATLISLLTLFVGATLVFAQLQDAMNTIWEVQPKPRRFWWDILRMRLLSFAMVLAVCFLLLISLVISAVLAATSSYLKGLLPGTEPVWPILDFVITFGITTVLFAMIYKILPDVHIHWNDVWIGAAATAVLFTIGKILIGLYLGRSSFASAYGAAGSLVVVLTWVYYSSQILFLGAEFTQVYANSYGSKVRPARGAITMSEYARIRQGIPHQETVDKAERKMGT
jgi:membrane protein